MAILLSGNPVDPLQKRKRIDRVNHRGQLYRLAHLVRLELADEMPLNVSRQNRRLFRQLRHPVLAETAHARLIQLPDC